MDSTTENRESLLLASYAKHSADSAGRVHDEPPHPYRGPFQRDRDRVVHSSAYRRLAHKTQVFTGEMGDYHRTRLTHTLEVASIARTIGRVLRLNEDLIEALCLVHDIGHPPFGHTGEEVLDERLAEHGGFNHNRQALRIVELLEARYPGFPGLNLTREVLSGQQSRASREVEAAQSQPLLEVQVVDAADSIAYDSHDADDALEFGLLQLDQLLEVPLWREAARSVELADASLDPVQQRRAIVHRLIETLVSDLITASQRRLADSGVGTVAQVQAFGRRLIEPSQATAEQKAELEDFLFHRVYRHPALLEERSVACRALEEMFDRFLQHPELLPGEYSSVAETEGLPRAVGDYLSAMTDRHALQQYRQPTPTTR